MNCEYGWQFGSLSHWALPIQCIVHCIKMYFVTNIIKFASTSISLSVCLCLCAVCKIHTVVNARKHHNWHRLFVTYETSIIYIHTLARTHTKIIRCVAPYSHVRFGAVLLIFHLFTIAVLCVGFFSLVSRYLHHPSYIRGCMTRELFLASSHSHSVSLSTSSIWTLY